MAARALGRIYYLNFAKYNATIAVNDLVDPDLVTKEIQNIGGEVLIVKGSTKTVMLS